MTSKKAGESQVIDFFSSVLRDELQNKFGRDKKFSVGNFSGSQDRKFADFFAGTESNCVLIEFKEFEAEIQDEQGKPLREKLCKELTADTAMESRCTHFIAFKSKGAEMNISLIPYVDAVCPLFCVGIPPLESVQKTSHKNFIQAFLDGGKGGSVEDFVIYAGRLNTIAGGIADGLSAPFKAVLYSRDSEGGLIGTLFQSLSEFKQLLGMKPKRGHRPN